MPIAHEGNVRHKGVLVEDESSLTQIRDERIEKSALARRHLAATCPNDPVVRPATHTIDSKIEGLAMNPAGDFPQ